MERKKLLIIGGDGHGSLIAATIKANREVNPDYEWEVAGFLNDVSKDPIDEYPVLGGTDKINEFTEQGYYFAWGIHLIAKNRKTVEAFKRMNIPHERLATIVHHTAIIEENVVLAPGCYVGPQAIIAPRVHLGIGTMVKAGASLGHDVKCGPLCHFARGSITGSGSKIGICSDVALGSIILDHGHIGDYSMAGSGSMVTHPIPDGEIWVGLPARFLKNMPD